MLDRKVVKEPSLSRRTHGATTVIAAAAAADADWAAPPPVTGADGGGLPEATRPSVWAALARLATGTALIMVASY